MKQMVMVLAAAMAFVACNKEQADAALGAAKKAEDVAKKASARADTSDADEPIGVDECDAYVKAMNACINELPSDEQSPARFQLASQQRNWQTMARDGNTEGVKAECVSATEVAKQTYGERGCAF